ncbi:hypothetical protein C5167_021642 [Papaver somniferum]|nr:hypothetical protein C5167_021642 [Papaver somniferum]
MEEINEVLKSGKTCYIVAVPFPGRGLINPMMNFCKDLAHKLDDKVKITFVVTEEWFRILESASMLSQIHLRSIPNVIPSEFVRSSTLDFDSFLEIVLAKMEAPFKHVLNTSDPATNGYSLANLSDCCDEVIDYIPGISPTRLADMPLLPSGNDPNFNPTIAAFNMLEKVQSLLIVSFYELEPQVTDTLKAIFPFPIYTVGPSISNISTAIEQHHHIDGKKTELNTVKYVNPKEPDYIEWLDSQPVGSVLYIAFGSTVPIPGVHVEEIMAGLHKSGVRYLLVSCGVHEGGEDDKMVGMEVTKEFGEKAVVKRDEVAKIVNKFMDINEDQAEEDANNEAKEMRRRSSELKDMCIRALAKGGSYDTNLDAFIKDILHVHDN